MTISNFEKQEISKKLINYCERYESQKKASNSLKGVSSATVSQVINGKWDLIKDDMFRNIAAQIGYEKTEWNSVRTVDFKLLTKFMETAQNFSSVFAITGAAGSGKTHTIKTYAAENKKVYVLSCSEFWTRRLFLSELLNAMGRNASGYSIGEMMADVIRQLKQQDKPLVILDEADKLTDQVFYFFITLYNNLEDCCGMILCSTDYLKRRIEQGINRNKKGYAEIFSRMGRKFIELRGVSFSDVRGICAANGIDSTDGIKEIWEDSEGDLRRVKRKIFALNALNSVNND